MHACRQAVSTSLRAVRASTPLTGNSSQANCPGSQLGTHYQADSTVSQAVNNSSQAGSDSTQAVSTSPQTVRANDFSQVNSTGSQPGTHSQADSAVCQAVNNSSQAGSHPRMLALILRQPGLTSSLRQTLVPSWGLTLRQ